MKKLNKDIWTLPALTLISLAVIAASIGTLTHDSNECTDAGLGFKFLGTGIFSGGTFFPGTGLDVFECTKQDTVALAAAETEAKDQVTRNIVNFASARISAVAPMAFDMGGSGYGGGPMDGGPNGDNKGAGSSDTLAGFAFWGDTTISQITQEHGKHFDVDIYQFTGGFDKAIGDVFFGSALSYAHTENEAGGTTSTSETVGITPYFAYKINDYIFASGMVGYIYTHTNRVDSGLDLDNHDYLTEGNINAYKVIDAFDLKGRAGMRYKHTSSSPEKGIDNRDNSFDELTWIGDVELGYMATDKLRIYTGLLYEYFDREQSGASDLAHDHIGFMRYGVDYPVNDSLSIGAKIQHDIIEEDIEFISGSLNARFAF